MRKSLIGTLFLGSVATLALTGCAGKMKPFAANYFTTNPNPLEAIGGKIPAVVTGNIPAKFFNKDAVVSVTPFLAYEGTGVPAATVRFQGDKVRGNNPQISYDRGGMMTIPVNFIYMPSMRKSELYLDFTVDQGGKQYVLPRVKVADGVIATSTLASASTINPALTPDKFQRVINEKYSADIRFLINQANLRQSELQSDAVKDLNKTIAATTDDPFREIREINIQSYASPEGALDFNTRLAENREKNTKSYVEGQLAKDKVKEFGELTAQFTPEDWEGFQKLVSQSNIQDKELILSVLSMYKDPEEREREIRNLSSVFDQLADQILPQLRYSRITASIDVIGKSDNEINRAIDNNPKDLTVDELLYGATLTEDPARKTMIYEKAIELFPNDHRGYNNLGLMQYKAGKYDQAKANFNKASQLAPNAPEVNMNKGLVSLLEHDYANANNEFGKAGGLDQLAEPLGLYYLEQGDVNAAVRAFGDVKSNNAAVAQIMAKDYSKAQRTLDAVANPDATTYYLKAIVAARTNDAAHVVSNLTRAKQLDPAVGNQAINDLEFARYNH